MTKSSFKSHNFDTIREEFTSEQILSYFNIKIDSNNKIKCLWHKEKTASMQVYERSVFCFGCKVSADNFDLARQLLQNKCNCEVTIPQVFAWFNEVKLPEKSDKKYSTGSHYIGEVSPSLIEYWHNQLDEEKYAQLQQDRLFTRETIDTYKLGWRPDINAWVIPFYRGLPGNSEIDVVQFRKVEGSPKYTSLYMHSRGSVMNAHLLEQPQDYLVVLFGAYDPILAWQDGVIAVGTNGSFPFKKDEKARVQELFSKQQNIFIVPDNTTAEFKPAYQMSEWLNAEVRFFDIELPSGCDYIDYRKLGYSAEDFKQDVLGIQPVTQVDVQYIEDIHSYLRAGDPYLFSSVYAIMAGRGLVASDVARSLAQSICKPFTSKSWPQMKRKLWQVKTENDLFKTLDILAKEANRLTGAW